MTTDFDKILPCGHFVNAYSHDGEPLGIMTQTWKGLCIECIAIENNRLAMDLKSANECLEVKTRRCDCEMFDNVVDLLVNTDFAFGITRELDEKLKGWRNA